jgi:hypothetical protein
MPDFGIFRGFNEKLFGDKLVAGQLPVNLGLIGSTDFSGTDPDALAFFARVTAAGGTLSATEQLAIDTLVRQMKLDGIWTKMKAIYPMVGASAAACAQNLKSSSFTGTFTSGWTFSSTGATPNGTSAYMDTGFNPNIQSLATSVNICVYNTTSENSGYSLACASAAFATVYGNLSRYNDNLSYVAIGSTFSPVTNLDGKGFYVATRNSNTQKMFKNNIQTISATSVGTILPNFNAYLSCVNVNGTASEFDKKTKSFASMGDGLTDGEASDFYTAVQAFQTTLNRQV